MIPGRAVQRLLRRSRLGQLAVRVGVRLLVARHRVGVAAVIRDGRGRVLIVEHAVRAREAWGLPGGWVDRHEDPRAAVCREVWEELGLRVAVERVLLCERQPPTEALLSPASLGIAFLCALLAESPDAHLKSREILQLRWVEPAEARSRMIRFHRKALEAWQNRAPPHSAPVAE
jgi:8-oxo-dGTP pyrophosphatase MutT (NUDIX family)